MVAILMFGMHLANAGTRGDPDLTVPDLVIPTLMVKVLPPFAAGIFSRTHGGHCIDLHQRSVAAKFRYDH